MSERNIAQMFEGPAHNLVWKNQYNEIIDEVYDKYDELFDSYYPAFSAPYPKRLTKEELVEEIKNGGKVIQEYELGVKIEEKLLEHSERKKLMDEYTDLRNMFRIGYQVTIDGFNYERYNEICDKYNIPTKQFTLEYKNETISYYE
jgi:hypothetical protein